MSKKTAIVKSMIFVPLAKVDEVARTVTGVVTAEVLDKAGETFHYESSVPYFKAWSASFETVTKGKSKGNVRSMHAAKAVGKLTEIEYDDAAKTITATAKIVDDAEWEKVVEGVYTGFSIGGNYVKQWEEDVDAQKVNYFTADPVEVSIVDNPCVPVAHFTVVKADGIEVQKNFKLYEPTNEEVAAKAAEIAGTGKNWVDFIEEAKTILKAEHGLPVAKVDEEDEEEDDEGKAEEEGKKEEDEEEEEEEVAEKVDAIQLVKQQWIATDGKAFDKKADCVTYQEGLNDPIKSALAKANAVLKTETAEPLSADNPLLIRGAYVQAIQAEYETDEAREQAIEAAKAAWVTALGTQPPEVSRVQAFLAEKAGEALGEVVKGWNDPELQKGSMWRIREWASAIDCVMCAAWYYDCDDDDKPIYDQMKTICLGLLTFMLEFVDHEVGQMIADLEKVAEPKGTLAKMFGSFQKKDPIDKTATSEVDKLNEELGIQKARADKLEKQVSDAVTGIEALTSEIRTLKDTPQPRRHPVGKTVDKSTDMGQLGGKGEGAETSLEELIKLHGQEEVSKMLIKISQTQPVRSL